MVTLAVLPGMLRISLVVANLANPGNSSRAINLLVSQRGIVGLGGLGEDLAEHQQDFLTPRRRQARPSLGQWPGKPRGLRRGGGQRSGGSWTWWPSERLAERFAAT